MTHGNDSISRVDTLAVLYLVIPLFVFFAFFIRFEIAVPACALIALQLFEMARRTAWQRPVVPRWTYLYFLALAGLWVWLSGSAGGLRLDNNDWLKHYSIINFLVENPWPSHASISELGDAVIRYSIGWYLVPAAALKLMDPHFRGLALSAWSAVGVFLFFSALPDLVGGTRRAVIAAPLVFIVFGGADLFGTVLNHYRAGPRFHFEWWASWIEYPANTTSLFWTPQHAIPAWLGAAIVMRQRERAALLRYLALLVSAILLWSPFSAVGLLPFLAVLAWRHGLRKMAFDWRPLASTALLAAPLALYLTAKSEAIPAGFIGALPCIAEHKECFTWGSYLLFLLLEVGLAVTILLLWRGKEREFLIVAACALCAIPLYRVGIYNDFAMRASLPALAVLAILSAKVLAAGPQRYSVAIVFVLLMALPTAVGEITRGFLPGQGISPETTFDEPWAAKYLRQYFAPLPVRVLRQ